MLLLAQGNALGEGNALMKVSRSVRAIFFMRGNAPCDELCLYGLRAFGAWHFCASAKMPNVLIAAYVSPGVARGYGQQLGLQPAPIIALVCSPCAKHPYFPSITYWFI